MNPTGKKGQQNPFCWWPVFDGSGLTHHSHARSADLVPVEVTMKIVGHGIDVVEVDRIRKLLATCREDFEPAWFTSAEQETAHQHSDPAPFYARRHAAKEAVLKALGMGLTQDISPMDVEIQTQDSGAPVVVLSGGALALAKQLGIGRWLISISDTEQLAIASALALQDDG